VSQQREILGWKGDRPGLLLVVAAEFEDVAAVQYACCFIVHLSARGEDLEEDGLESPALALRVALSKLGGARRGGAASRW